MGVEVHAVDVVPEDAAFEINGEMHVIGDGIDPAEFLPAVVWVELEAALPVLADALEGADEEGAGAAGGIKDAEGAGVLVEGLDCRAFL